MPEDGLPEPFTIRDFEGSFDEYVERLWWTYRALLHEFGIEVWGKPLVGGGGGPQTGTTGDAGAVRRRADPADG